MIARICGMVLGLCLASPAALADEPPLKHDPFHRPGSSGGTSAQRRDVASWRPELRATLGAGAGSLVNLGGVILRIGEETHGYQLVEVGDREATFLRGEARVVLHLEPAERAR